MTASTVPLHVVLSPQIVKDCKGCRLTSHVILTNFAINCQYSFMEANMATMNVSLPDPMKDWVETQARTGRYANASDYVRDLIRRDQERNDKVAAMQRFVDDGLKSGVGNRSKDQLFAAARVRGESPSGNG